MDLSWGHGPPPWYSPCSPFLAGFLLPAHGCLYTIQKNTCTALLLLFCSNCSQFISTMRQGSEAVGGGDGGSFNFTRDSAFHWCILILLGLVFQSSCGPHLLNMLWRWRWAYLQWWENSCQSQKELAWLLAIVYPRTCKWNLLSQRTQWLGISLEGHSIRL